MVTFSRLQGDGELSALSPCPGLGVPPIQLFCSSSPKVQCPPFRIPPPGRAPGDRHRPLHLHGHQRCGERLSQLQPARPRFKHPPWAPWELHPGVCTLQTLGCSHIPVPGSEGGPRLRSPLPPAPPQLWIGDGERHLAAVANTSLRIHCHAMGIPPPQIQ